MIFIFCSFNRKEIFHLGRGRGRGRSSVAKEFEAPGGLQDYADSETASCVSYQSETSYKSGRDSAATPSEAISDMSRQDSAATPSEEVGQKIFFFHILIFCMSILK